MVWICCHLPLIGWNEEYAVTAVVKNVSPKFIDVTSSSAHSLLSASSFHKPFIISYGFLSSSLQFVFPAGLASVTQLFCSCLHPCISCFLNYRFMSLSLVFSWWWQNLSVLASFALHYRLHELLASFRCLPQKKPCYCVFLCLLCGKFKTVQALRQIARS